VVSSPSAPATSGPVTVITQTRVLPDRNDDFAKWQQHVSDIVAGFPGSIDHRVIPPDPPQQVDWVILQKFATSEDAQGWLRCLVASDDVNVVVTDQQQLHVLDQLLALRRAQPGLRVL
jgi:antibiotic biosynthesis monooxygenase (ABM) superfamily enzyme